jgi:hypothetical protein
MSSPADLFKNAVWVLTAFLQVGLLVFVLRRRACRGYPAFLVYVVAATLENAVVFFTYRHWAFNSLRAWTIAWSTQAAVLGARWFAVAEIAREIFSNYGGIRALVNRILFVLGICVLAYAAASSKQDWTQLLLYADRGVELGIAVFIVGLFVFARYYRLPVSNLNGQLAIGFCIYSCSSVVNISIFERWPNTFSGLWYYLAALSYFASLLLWIQAVRRPVEAPQPVITTQISPEMYAAFSQKLNSRLDTLNSRLSQLLRSEGSRS